MDPDDSFSLFDLVEKSGVGERTVRYYFQRGILPPPPAQGRGARYPRGYLDRLLLIRKLQEEDWSLELIQRKLNSLSDVDVAELLRQTEQEKPGASGDPKSLAGYLQHVLPSRGKLSSPPTPDERPWHGRRAGAYRTRWDRISLTDDVEILVRHPLTREKAEQIEELIKAALNILKT